MRILVLIALCLTIFTVKPIYAATFNQQSFDETIAKAEAIVIANIASVDSFSIGDMNNENMTLSNVGIFSVINLENTETIESRTDGIKVGKAVVYIDGGKIPMPRVLKELYKYETLGELNTAIPILNSKDNIAQVLFLCGNGKIEVPFCGSPNGILEIGSDNTVRFPGGTPINRIFEGELIADNPSSSESELEFPRKSGHRGYTAAAA